MNNENYVPRKADKKLMEMLIEASNILYMEGQSDMHNGQISARIMNEEEFWIKGATVGFEEMADANTIRMDVGGKILFGTMGAPPEWNLHAEIYKARQEVRCIIHTHPRYSTLFGATGMKLLPISHEACPFYEALNVFDDTTNTILDMETGKLVAKRLGANNALLLRNHGIVTVGKTVKQATLYALLLEKACDLQLSLKGYDNLLYSTKEDAALKNDYIFSDAAISSYWDYYVRKLARRKDLLSSTA